MEKQLDYKKLCKVLSNERYFSLLDSGYIKVAIGLNDVKKLLDSQKFDFPYRVNEDAFDFESTGLVVEYDLRDPYFKNLSNETLRRVEYKRFYNEVELIQFLESFKQERYDSRYSSVSEYEQKQTDEHLLSGLASQFEQLSDKEKSALIVYKTRMFSVMNYLWQKYGDAENCDIKELNGILEKDYKNIINILLTEDRKKIVNEERNFQRLLNSQFEFFSKAKKNPLNEDFFSKIPGIQLDDVNSFLCSIIDYMKVMECIDSITAPCDFQIYRGIYGTSKLDKISRSKFASCTPDIDTAAKFARNVINGSGAYGNNAMLCLDIKKGTPITPIMFSVKTSIKGVASDEGIGYIDYSKLEDESIFISLDMESKNIQEEILINTSKCAVTSFSDLKSEDCQIQQDTRVVCCEDELVQTDDYEHQLEIVDIIEENLDFLPSGVVITQILPGYSHAVYKNITVTAKQNVSFSLNGKEELGME